MDAEQHQEIARCLFRESNDGLFIFEPRDDRVRDVNPAALRLTGFSRKSLCNMRIGELFTSADPNAIRELSEAYRRTSFFHSREGYSLTVRAGPPVPVNLSVTRIHTRPEPLGLVTARDVSEIRRAKEIIERFFRLSPALFAIVELGESVLRFVKLNPAWENALGYSIPELIAMSPWDLVHPDDKPAARVALQRVVGEQQISLEQRLLRKDGLHRWISWQAFALEGMLYAVGRDTTEEKRARALAVAKEAAEAANRAKSNFLALVSHELRTPLTSILGFTEHLLGDPHIQAGPAPCLESMRVLRQSAELLMALIDDLLSLTIVESGTHRVKPTRCSPAEIVADLVATLGPRAEGKGLRFEIECEGDIPDSITTDDLRVRQILSNLVGNAIKFTEAGEVRLKAGMVETNRGEPAIQWTVTDTGPGLTAEERALLFEPFYRSESSLRRGISGTGLGLAISRRLAELLQGQLECESAPGVGSRFTLVIPTTLPVSQVADSVVEGLGGVLSATSTPPTVPAHIPGRVLLAEDNLAIQRVIALQLRRAGSDVEVADNGQAAVELALSVHQQGKPFDIILMDVQMPVMDGYEATRRLRAEGIRTPIIALTAYASTEDRSESIRIGCDDHISKPFKWTDLAVLLVAHMGKASTREPS